MSKIAAISSVWLLALAMSNAHAADIRFTGELVAASCKVSGGGTPDNIAVNMGKVSTQDLGTGAAGAFGPTTDINLTIDCASGMVGLSTVKMSFDPFSGTGSHYDDSRLLALENSPGAATGVGIALINDANTILNLSKNEPVSAPLVVTGGAATAELHLRAAYIKAGAILKAGPANANMPFSLSYE
ncbi:putative major fimbrial subunit LpfA [Pseudomonas fluorescens]|uniref:fimbrial protein n=1 Tax=Pseudomonas fluorescens TaxID=294 RepID=UPI0012416C16|nr:fimbrial protein [Pseudomonas fluorescens]VVP32929.1 putative major fimbrial subunit LpfA [Pseudomonas fluorescens]